VKVAALGIAVAALAVAGSAAGMRKPTAGEAKAIREAVAGFIAMPNSPSAKNNKVVAISVSTADPRYAAAQLSSPTVGRSVLLFHQSMDTWWEIAFGSSIGCNSAPKSVLADLKIGCEPPAGVAWISTCGPLVSAPTQVVLACADGNYELTKVTWHGWGKATAAGTATATANDCTPNCAAGHFHKYPATVSATALKSCGKARYYAKLTITYPGKRPMGIGTRDVHQLGC
jgi:hypothetical protein